MCFSAGSAAPRAACNELWDAKSIVYVFLPTTLLPDAAFNLIFLSPFFNISFIIVPLEV